MGIKKGDYVRQVVHVIEGVVVSRKYDEDTDTLVNVVEYPDAEGATQQSVFTDAQIEVVPVEPEAPTTGDAS